MWEHVALVGFVLLALVWAILLGREIDNRKRERQQWMFELAEERIYRETAEDLLRQLYNLADMEAWQRQAPKATAHLLARIEAILGIRRKT